LYYDELKSCELDSLRDAVSAMACARARAEYLSDSKVLGNSVGGLDAKFAEYFLILLNLASTSRVHRHSAIGQ